MIKFNNLKDNLHKKLTKKAIAKIINHKNTNLHKWLAKKAAGKILNPKNMLRQRLYQNHKKSDTKKIFSAQIPYIATRVKKLITLSNKSHKYNSSLIKIFI